VDQLGIDIGSTSVKLVLKRTGQVAVQAVQAHDGEIPGTLERLLAAHGLSKAHADLRALCTGGSNTLRVPKVIPAQAIEAGLEALAQRPAAVVSLGGESIVVYTLDERGRVSNALTGDKCAAGTGEFFRQQLGRMDMDLDVLERIPADTCSHAISARCSVFMKSDCTHKLNKKEATKEEIVVSLAEVMANKVVEFLTRARVTGGQVLLIGGVTRNRFLRRSLQRQLPGVQFEAPAHAEAFEAFGAARLAGAHGGPLPPAAARFEPGRLSFEHYPALAAAEPLVRPLPPRRARVRAGAEYVLGIDGGSTTTKAVLVDSQSREIVASYYGRTHGDPVAALRTVLAELRCQVQEQIGDAGIRLRLAATTGSSREVLGVFVETPGVYNEIIAHAVGTTHFCPQIDTIFEIGGQDAKYVFLRNGVPIDYAMNEACSAGTGSFIEESARGDLNIRTAPEIGPVALRSEAPLKFGEHCSAFINSDIRKAIQEGAGKADIVAGIVFSVVTNYLNRVVGNRNIGGNIVLQGGVAKNPALPLAFATVLGKPIVVPPDPELLGAFGVALLALDKHADGLLKGSDYTLDELIERPIRYGRVFTCKACENLCPVRTLHVGGHRHFFGGRCNKYANMRRPPRVDLDQVSDYVALRQQLLYETYAPDALELRATTEHVVGVPKAFSVHSLWPLYSWFFHDLGVRTVLSETPHREGVQRAEAAYCLPGEIAHAMTEDLLRRQVDYYFLPHFKNMQSLEPDVHATLCPITQGLPYYLRPAFGLADDRILRPIVRLGEGWDGAADEFADVAVKLGYTREEGLRAYRVGVVHQKAFFERLHTLGAEALHRLEGRPDETVIVLFGRPYNAFPGEANMGIPRKLATRGYTVLPYDFLQVGDEAIADNQYWYFGQHNLKAARRVKEHPNLFLCYVSNFGCAPDSFLLHFVRWCMGAKPFLVLELDSHTADAGIDTRIEAFLDIIEGYRLKAAEITERSFERRYSVHWAGANTRIVDADTGARLSLKDPRVRLVWPSMGSLGTAAVSAVADFNGVRSEHLPPATVETTQLARNVASGKECIPTLLVLGQILKLLLTRPPARDEVLAVIVPKTTGPCRTGQYGPFYERVFGDLGVRNVAVLTLSSDNGYKELGPSFSRHAWTAALVGDFFTDMRLALRLVARHVDGALAAFDSVWRGVVGALRRDPGSVARHLKEQATPALQRISRRRTLDSLRRVLVVGEIYVRRDDFSISELTEQLVANDIFPKVTGVGEWVHYCDFTQRKRLQQRLARKPWHSWAWSPELLQWGKVAVEMTYTHHVEKRLKQALAPSGLLPDYPDDMGAIMATVDEFTHVEFETEATVSTLVGAMAGRDGYDGVAVIAPFACLPGRLIKAMLDPFAREHGIPFIALENDGQPYPPNILSRLEIFMLNVLRRREQGATYHPVGVVPLPGTDGPKERLELRKLLDLGGVG